MTESDAPATDKAGSEYDQWDYAGYYDPEFESVVNRELDRIGSLAPNWDAEGASRIDPEIVDAARQFIARLPESIARLPAVVPMAKGNLQFEWHEGPRSLELEIESPNRIHYLKWYPEEGIEEEGLLSIRDITRAEILIRWFMGGVANV